MPAPSVESELGRENSRYRTAAGEKDWALCKQLAEAMWRLGGDGAEVQYALAYALERLGELDEARTAYRVVLTLDSRHLKARGRLHALAVSAPPPSR